MTRENGSPHSTRRLTVLGSCGAFPEPGRACSGFAIDWDGYRLAGLEPDVDLTAVFGPHPLPGHYQVGPFQLTGVPLPHFVFTAGLRLQAGPTALAYSGDTGPALAELGRNTGLFIIEATDRPADPERPSGLRHPTRNLLTPAQAGRFGRQAGARRLVLTHFWPGNERAASITTAAARKPHHSIVIIPRIRNNRRSEWSLNFTADAINLASC